MTVERMSVARPIPRSVLVKPLDPFHSFRAMPQSELKMMMLAMWMVQLENLYLPICVSPMV